MLFLNLSSLIPLIQADFDSHQGVFEAFSTSVLNQVIAENNADDQQISINKIGNIRERVQAHTALINCSLYISNQCQAMGAEQAGCVQ